MSNDSETLLLLLRRQLVLDHPIGLFKGPNSLHNFASSFTRAQLFAAQKLDPHINRVRSFFGGDDEVVDTELMAPASQGERLSTLIGDRFNDVFLQDDISSVFHARSRQGSVARRITLAQLFSSHHLAVSWAASWATSSHLGLKQVDRDGKLIPVLAGQLTAPQTTVNSVNVMIGVGLLALPVALLRAGWVLGVPILVACCLSTCWTAMLLSRALDTDETLMTYADLGYAAYGATAKLVISVLFLVDLVGLGVLLVVLFSDLLHALLGPQYTRTWLKAAAFFVLTPFSFLPLPVLLIFSMFGIALTFSIIFLVAACGAIKHTAPGLLIETMPTNLWPLSVSLLFVAVGIFMAPFGGHAIFPNLKADMRHPHKFPRTLVTTYTVVLFGDCAMAIIGFLMFGKLCSNEITSVVLETPGYPPWVYPLISGLICIVPLAKTPLNAKPITSTLDGACGVLPSSDDQRTAAALKATARFLIKVAVNAVFVVFAIFFPEFDRIVGVLGSSICFLICIVLPCLFYLKLCGGSIAPFERVYLHLAVAAALALAVACTYATIAY